jgi:hypothetical protein
VRLANRHSCAPNSGTVASPAMKMSVVRFRRFRAVGGNRPESSPHRPCPMVSGDSSMLRVPRRPSTGTCPWGQCLFFMLRTACGLFSFDYSECCGKLEISCLGQLPDRAPGALRYAVGMVRWRSPL